MSFYLSNIYRYTGQQYFDGADIGERFEDHDDQFTHMPVIVKHFVEVRGNISHHLISIIECTHEIINESALTPDLYCTVLNILQFTIQLFNYSLFYL